MKLHPRVSRSLVELVKGFEGLRRRAARLPDDSWTIGYGHTKSAREGAVVSPEDAEALLYYDLSEVAEKVDAWTFTPLNQNQFEALVAFAFNIGMENFRRSTVLKRVNEGQHLQAAGALELWRKAEFGGEGLVIDALVRRRAAEKARYLTPPEGFRPSPTPVLRPAYDYSLMEIAALSRPIRPVVVDAPLDGDEAAAHLESGPPPGASDAAFPLNSVETMEHDKGASAVVSEVEPDGPPPADPFVIAAPSTTSPLEPDHQAAGFEARQDAVVSNAADVSPTVAQALPTQDASASRHSGLLHDRAIVYLCIGLLGVALFLAALFSMLSGKATPVNLIVGLLGILSMTPAGGYFLLRFLHSRQPAPEL